MQGGYPSIQHPATMKYLLIICLSLLVSGGLGTNQFPDHIRTNCTVHTGTSLPAGLQVYWLRKTRKEVMRDVAYSQQLRKALVNSCYFIFCGFAGKLCFF